MWPLGALLVRPPLCGSNQRVVINQRSFSQYEFALWDSNDCVHAAAVPRISMRAYIEWEENHARNIPLTWWGGCGVGRSRVERRRKFSPDLEFWSQSFVSPVLMLHTGAVTHPLK